jgi:diguanylate cyclase (GGDEF)-like protein/PAS domain S-box-containing protein
MLESAYRERTAFGWRLAAIGVLVFLSCAYSQWLTRSTGSSTSIWIANGVIVGFLLHARTSRWPLFLAMGILGHILANLIYARPLMLSLGLDLAGLVEVLIVAGIMRWQFPAISGSTPFFRIGRIALLSALAGCVVSGTLAALTLHLYRGDALWTTMDTWCRAHGLGMAIVGTLTFVVLGEGLGIAGTAGKRWKFIRTMGLVSVVTFAVFTRSQYPMLFMVYPPLLWAVFRHRFAGLVVGIALVALISSFTAGLGMGPFVLIPGVSRGEYALLLQVFIAVACLSTIPVALALAERERFETRIRESELRYRTLADHAGDLVMRIRADGRRLYVSPSIKELLGWEIEEFLEPRGDLIHPDDLERVANAVAALRRDGGSSTTTYRMRHTAGHYIWFEALARLVSSPDGDGSMEIVYTGRDITARVLAEEALADSERRLRMITDNIPAVIAHIDENERYVFVNAYVQSLSGDAPTEMIGRTVREVRGEAIYAEVRQHIATVLAGQPITFEYEGEMRGERHYFQSCYVPDWDTEGHVRGVFALTTDITHIKHVEQELSRLAHYDTLTGLANRRHFNERMSLALDQARQESTPLLLMIIDVDHFKGINDAWGHGVGDGVLKEVGQRIQACVRKHDLVARIGGDEFVVLVEDIDSPAAAEALARKVTAAMEADMHIGALRLPVTVSMGIALCRGAASADELMQIADEVLYAAKGAGRDTFRLAARAV